MKIKSRCAIIVLLGVVSLANSACDCGSIDQSSPCTGQNIDINVGNSRTVGFNWTFNSAGEDAYCGQFANGDFWIAPADGQNVVTISGLTGSGSGSISLDENAKVDAIGLLSSDPDQNYGNYDAKQNLMADLPMSFNQNTSLVAAIQRDENQHGGCGTNAILGNCAEAYHVVTILQNVPVNAGKTMLRPSIDEVNKELLDLSAFDLNRMPKLKYLSPLNGQQLANIRQKWSHSTEIFSIQSSSGETFSEGGRAFRANLFVDDYAAGVARSFVSDVVSLMAASNPSEETQQALAAILTYGKDLYYSVYDHDVRTAGWGSGAGQHLGKFPPAVLFAALYDGSFYRDVLKQTSLTMLGVSQGELAGTGPQELEQINVGINGPIWGDGTNSMGRYDIGRYWSELLDSQCYDGALGECTTSGGKKTTRDPHNIIDGPPKSPGSAYMAVSAGPIRGFAALAHLIPEVCETINYPLLTEYTDRIGTLGLQTNNDMCAPPDNREVFGVEGGCDAFRAQNCEYYGLSNTGVATWGPVSFDPQAACIPNNSGGNTGQNGRFPHLHGQPVNIGYRSVIIEDHWQSIRNSAHPCVDDTIFMDGFE